MSGTEGSGTEGLPKLPVRKADAHKGDAGGVGVIAGCAGPTRMIGAAALVARGAFRAGAGLVRLGMPAPIVDAALGLEPSAMGVTLPVDDEGYLIGHRATQAIDELAERSDVLVVGPGLGGASKSGSGSAMEGPRSAALRAVQQLDAPVVVDADAINALAGLSELTREVRGSCVFTPHPGEFDRLAGAVNLGRSVRSGEHRERSAEELAQRLGAIVVLKGAGTVVSDGHRTWTCPHGHPCMATAGTGDVLAGVIAGLIAQHAMPPAQAAALAMLPEQLQAKMPGDSLSLYDCARLGVAAHALAGERWAEQATAGLLARELADLVPVALDTLRAER